MNYEAIQPLLNWISAHPHWSGLAVFFISLSESLAVVGLFVPGVIMMTAIGSLIGAGLLPAGLTLLWAMLGAVVGDGISYWLGYVYKEHLRDFWPFRQFPKWLDRGQVFFQHHGGKSIVFGRFVGPVRPMIPVIAGMMHMSPRYFLWTNIVSAVLWAPLYSLPGILIGASLGTLEADTAKRVGLLILISLFLVWFAYLFVKKILLSFSHTICYFSHAFWQNWQRLPYATLLKNYLTPKDAPRTGQIGTVVIWLLSASTLLGLLYTMTATVIPQADLITYQLFRALYYKPVIDQVLVVNGLGAPRVLLPVIAVIGIGFAYRRHWIASLVWLGGMGAFIGTGYLLKFITMHPRPEGLIQVTQEFSFPSGHTLVATLCFGLLAALSHLQLKPAYRWIPWSIAVPAISIVALARLYLQQHWLSDIIASISLGTLGISTILLIYRRLTADKIALTTLYAPALITLSITFSLYLYQDYPTLQNTVVPEWPVHVMQQETWWHAVPKSLYYRVGILPKQEKKEVLNVQWSGTFKTLENQLMQSGWKSISTISAHNIIHLFSTKAQIENFPALPLFHQGRLPVATFVKAVSDDAQKRLALYVWNSDYRSENNSVLWVGCLRHETLKRPWQLFGLVSLYKKELKPILLEALAHDLTHLSVKIQHTPVAPNDNRIIEILTVKE